MLVIDTETGGLDAGRCALLGVAAIHLESGAEFSLLIRPHVSLDLDAEALEVNGLTMDHLLAVGTDEGEAMQTFAMWLHVFGPQEWFGCNPSFDQRFLEAAFARHEVKARLRRGAVCVQTLAWAAHSLGKLLLPVGKDGLPKRSLDAILGGLGLARESMKHDALEDCRLTLAAFRELVSRLSGGVK